MSVAGYKARLPIAALTIAFISGALFTSSAVSFGQMAAAPVARATPQRGTVKTIQGNNLTVTTDAGQEVVVTVPSGARIQRLAPGSTDLKTAEPAALTDVAVGDRVLATGSAGDSPAAFTASRVILMKSTDIAQKHEAEQQDWQTRGAGGIVKAVDPAGAITVASGARQLQIVTNSSTVFRRYSDGSVKFEDAKPGTLAQIQPGDQLLARGAKSTENTSVQAEEVVSGSFKNLSGTLVSVDTAKGIVSLKDLVSKKNVTVQITSSSSLRKLPPQTAQMFATRAKGGSAAAGASGGSAPQPAATERPAAQPGEHAHAHSGGGDLSTVVARLPPSTLADLHAGDAVMIVAEQSSADFANLTAITLLAGVEPILAAAPSGSPAMTLSPWSVGTGAPEGGGGAQ